MLPFQHYAFATKLMHSTDISELEEALAGERPTKAATHASPPPAPAPLPPSAQAPSAARPPTWREPAVGRDDERTRPQSARAKRPRPLVTT